MKKRYLLGAGLAVAALAACAPTGLDQGFGTNGVLVRGLSTDTNDRFLSVADGPDGTVFAGGYTTLAGGDQAFAVAKLDRAGNLVPGFGANGVAVLNVAVGTTGEVGRTVAVQADGKIVLGGPVDHVGGDVRDRDGAVVRFNADGTPDATFGTGGKAIVDYGTGRVASDTNPAFLVDDAWGLGSLPDGRVVLWGLTPAATGTDRNFSLAGLTNTGTTDTTFGTNGFVTFDGTGTASSDNARNVLVQPDGNIVAIGYSIPASGVTQPIILRVSSAGVRDTTFGTDGVATANVLPGVAEAYGIRQHLGGYVLAGYGNAGGADTNIDQIIYKFSNTGVWDQTFGTAGVVRVDIAGLGLADRSRNIEVLPDNRILVPGTATVTAPVPATPETPAVPANVNGLVTLLSPTGAFDGYFGTGGKVVSDLGGPNDAWFGVTYSAEDNTVWVGGYKGIAGTVSATNNDDAAIARIDLNK